MLWRVFNQNADFTHAYVYAEKPGMGVEPIYSCSAGNRLNRSATPAVYRSLRLG